MFYILQLDDNAFVTHSEDIGWHVTFDLFEASRLGSYWVEELMERFQDDLDEQGHINLEGMEFDEVTILEVEYNVKNKTKGKDYLPENLKKYNDIDPN